MLSSLLRSRPDTLGTGPALASDFSPLPEPAEKGQVCCWTWPCVPKHHLLVTRMSRPCHCSWRNAKGPVMVPISNGETQQE